MSTLELKDVKYTYKGKYQTVDALRGVDYSFESGKFYAVMGKSGSGKTTLLSVMAGLDIPTDGEIFLEGENIANTDRDLLRLKHIAVVYQSLNLFPLMTVLENVMFPLEYAGTHKDDARAIAEEKLLGVGIESDMFKRLPSMLSGGEQQRVAIARALAGKAKIILADEPTGNLDSENSLNIIKLLRDLTVSEDVCVIVVTHDPVVAENADVVLNIKDGKIEYE